LVEKAIAEEKKTQEPRNEKLEPTAENVEKLLVRCHKCNAENDEELSWIVSQDPLFYHTKREIYPLTTPEVHKKHIREILAKR